MHHSSSIGCIVILAENWINKKFAALSGVKTLFIVFRNLTVNTELKRGLWFIWNATENDISIQSPGKGTILSPVYHDLILLNHGIIAENVHWDVCSCVVLIYFHLLNKKWNKKK